MREGEQRVGSTFPAWSRARAVAALVPSVPAVVCPQYKPLVRAYERIARTLRRQLLWTLHTSLLMHFGLLVAQKL